MSRVQVFPSILSADFGKLAEEAKHLEQAGADGIHIDIMDGHFVPNLTLGPKAVSAINQATSLFLDVHLMMYRPFDYIEQFVDAGADRVTFHFEATEDIEDTIEFIHRCGAEAGIALSPETPVECIEKVMSECELVLLMTVSPGFGGQTFLHAVLDKIEETKVYVDRLESGRNPLRIQVDGGITPQHAKECYMRGATCFVSGNYLFQQGVKQGIAALKEACGL